MNINEYDYFRELVRECRLCYIGGAYVGKTALAVRLAQDFHQEGYRIWANINLKGASNLDRIFALDKDEPSCVILELASLELADEQYAQAFLDHVRFRNIIVLIPSAGPPHDLLRVLECYVNRTRRKRYLPKRWQPKGLECYWHIPGATYRGAQGKFRWENPEVVYGLYDHRDPGNRGYMDGYSAYIWQHTLRQAVRDLDGPITVDDFDILVRPGQLFMLCLWLHSQLVYLLALKQASEEERDKFRHDPYYQGSIIEQRVKLHRKNLGPVITDFQSVFDSELMHEDLNRMEGLKFIRNSLAHSFFSLHHLKDEGGFLSYVSNRKEENDTIWQLFTDEAAAQSYMNDFLELGICFNRLCQNMDIDYNRIL